MLTDLLFKDKTLKGSTIFLVAALLSRTGLDFSVMEIGEIIGLGVAAVGWIHKGAKKVKNRQRTHSRLP